MSDSGYLPAGKLPGNLLNRLLTDYRTPRDTSVVVGSNYGFDAAALTIGGETLLVKSDPITFASSDAARYLVAVNANDIACLGGVPRWMTVVSLLPEGTTRSDVERQFAELQRACGFEGISLIGGHTEITVGIDRPLLIGTLLGTVGRYGLLKPGMAQAGNDLWLTQSAGIEGTALLASEREDELLAALGPDIVGVAKGLLIEPGISVSRDARALLATGNVTALHDPTEGGVATAIHEIAAASGLGAEIDGAAIPVLPETAAICDHFGIDPLGLLSSGSLLVATPPGVDIDLLANMVLMTRIGTLTDTPDTLTISTDRGIEPLRRFDSDEIARVLLQVG
jgi:hydrogenase maturation factor